MSTPQRTHARITLVLDYSPEAQCALAMRYQDAIDLITTVGWDPASPDPKTRSFEIVLTHDLVKQLAHRRVDLGATNADRLNELDDGQPVPANVRAEINADRNGATALDRVIGAYSVAVARKRR
jgi:hypothetical protein